MINLTQCLSIHVAFESNKCDRVTAEVTLTTALDQIISFLEFGSEVIYQVDFLSTKPVGPEGGTRYSRDMLE